MLLHNENCLDEVMKILQLHQLTDINAVELFSGAGLQWSQHMARHCVSLNGYDIDRCHKKLFCQNIPNGNFFAGDSILLTKECKIQDRSNPYNLISLDNPLCIYGNDYCEHFEIVSNLNTLICDKCALVFNVVRQPYNAIDANNSEWIARRNLFYNKSSLNLELEYLKAFYKEVICSQNISVIDIQIVNRATWDKKDFLYVMVCILAPKSMSATYKSDAKPAIIGEKEAKQNHTRQVKRNEKQTV